MKNEVKEKLRIWLSQFPQSTHPLDSRRFYDVVIAMRDTDSSIDDEDIREMLQECKPDWNEKYVEEFIHEKTASHQRTLRLPRLLPRPRAIFFEKNLEGIARAIYIV